MKKIKIKNETGNVLVTRESIQLLFKNINKLKDKEIIFDFKDVNFMSRSGADEYLKQKNRCNKNIVDLNQPKRIRSMIQIVESANSNNKPVWQEVPTIRL